MVGLGDAVLTVLAAESFSLCDATVLAALGEWRTRRP